MHLLLERRPLQMLQQVSSEEGARAAAALGAAPAKSAAGAQLGALGDFLLARSAPGVRWMRWRSEAADVHACCARPHSWSQSDWNVWHEHSGALCRNMQTSRK